MKSVKKLIAVILVTLLTAGSFSVMSFAATRKNYLLLGDSIAYGQGLANSQEACYGKIVADTNSYNYTNYAVSGSTSGVLLDYIDEDFVNAAVKKANIISISIGGNDFLTKNMPLLFIDALLGTDIQFNSIKETFASNFAAIIQKIKTLSPKAKILVQTVYNPNDTFVSDVYQKGVDVINGVIKDYLAANKGAFTVVDVCSAFAGHHEYIAADTIHPNKEGNLVIAKLTLKTLKTLKLGTTTTPVVKVEGIDWNDTSSSSMDRALDYFINMFVKYFGILLA